MDKIYKAILEHDKSLTLYSENVPLFPLVRVCSFFSPTHSMIYNNMLNFKHWHESDNVTKLNVMQVCTPKMKFSKGAIWANYVKKPEAPKKTKKSEKQIEWLCKVFEVSKKRAESYLEFDGVSEAVVKAMQ